MLSDAQLRALMLEMHAAIARAGDELAAALARGDADLRLLPPGGHLSPAERERIAALAPQAAAAEDALRKLVSDACACALFDLSMPDDRPQWQPMLHDELTETWWDWDRLG